MSKGGKEKQLQVKEKRGKTGKERGELFREVREESEKRKKRGERRDRRRIYERKRSAEEREWNECRTPEPRLKGAGQNKGKEEKGEHRKAG